MILTQPVRARRRRSMAVAAVGVFVGAAALCPARAASQSIALTAMELLDQYDHGDRTMSAAAFAGVIHVESVRDALAAEGAAWIAAGGKDDIPRRRLVAATFALEAARAGLDHEWANSVQLIDWAWSELRQQSTPLPAERYWHLAAIALFQGAYDSAQLETRLGRLKSRFPGEPRLLLVAAWSLEVPRPPNFVMPPMRGKPGGVGDAASDVAHAYVKASASSDTAVSAEAHVHLAYFDLIADRSAGALDHLAQAERKTSDPHLVFLAHLFHGWTLARLDRASETTAEYPSGLQGGARRRHGGDLAGGAPDGRRARRRSQRDRRSRARRRCQRRRSVAALRVRRVPHVSAVDETAARTHQMTRRPLTLVLAVALGASLVAAQSGQRPTFRAGTDVVTITAFVRQGNVIVPGLGPSDFALTDNGVPQTVQVVPGEAVPFDLTIALDLSGSVFGMLDQLKRQLREVAALLRPDDHLRIVTFSDRIADVTGFVAGDADLPLDDLRAGPLTPLYDAMAMTLMRRRPADRGQVVVVLTDGFDTSSTLSLDQVLDVARRSEDVLYVFIVHRDPGALPTLRENADLRRFWLPERPDVVDGTPPTNVIGDVARVTGGDLDEIIERDHVPASLRRAIDDFRASYILQYTVQGVNPKGRHAITIKINRPGDFQVRARQQYDGGA